MNSKNKINLMFRITIILNKIKWKMMMTITKMMKDNLRMYPILMIPLIKKKFLIKIMMINMIIMIMMMTITIMIIFKIKISYQNKRRKNNKRIIKKIQMTGKI